MIEIHCRPTPWSADGIHLVAKEGEKVFQEEKDAVVKLQELIKQRPAYAASLQPFIDTMVEADKALAQTAIADASGGDSKKIGQANDELARGDADRVGGRFTNVIEHYRNAWKKALEAKG